MNIIKIVLKMNLTNEYYNNQSKQAVEKKLNMIVAKNPYLIKSLNRFHNHPLIKKYSDIPFNNF